MGGRESVQKAVGTPTVSREGVAVGVYREIFQNTGGTTEGGYGRHQETVERC